LKDETDAIRNTCPQVIQTVTRATDGIIEFTSIPQTFTSLELLINARVNQAGAVIAVNIQFNGDTAGNYRYQALQANNTTTSSLVGTSVAGIQILVFPGNVATAGNFGSGRVHIPFYRSNRVKSVIGEANAASATAADSFHRHGGGFWNNTAAITSLRFEQTMFAGSQATLIGIP
jgi:hypothetical protein